MTRLCMPRRKELQVCVHKVLVAPVLRGSKSLPQSRGSFTLIRMIALLHYVFKKSTNVVPGLNVVQ